MAVVLEFTQDAETEQQHVSRLIYQRRVASGRSSTSVALGAGVSLPHYSQIESGTRTGTPAMLRKIAAELGIDEDELYAAYRKDGDAALCRKWQSIETS